MNMPTRLHLVLLAIVASALMTIPQSGHAQMRGFGMRAGFAPRGELRGAPWRGHARRGLYLGDPFWYSDYVPDEPYYDEAAPQVILLKPQVADTEPPQPRVQPLMIELQGDRYVRTGGYETASESVRTAGLTVRVSDPVKSVSAGVASTLSTYRPTVLIYRDGHHEDISSYAIIKSMMYAHGDYWRDGYWTKNIQLSALDIPATLKVNQENGVRFILPSGPNEVVTRP